MNGPTFVEHAHPRRPDAYVHVEHLIDEITVSCMWPLDISSGEWFKLEFSCLLSDFAARLTSLFNGATSSITDEHYRVLKMQMSEGGEISFEMSNGAGPIATTLILDAVFMRSELEALLVPTV
jgi:hypothetical protein